jgi:hypothetical protein
LTTMPASQPAAAPMMSQMNRLNTNTVPSSVSCQGGDNARI